MGTFIPPFENNEERLHEGRGESNCHSQALEVTADNRTQGQPVGGNDREISAVISRWDEFLEAGENCSEPPVEHNYAGRAQLTANGRVVLTVVWPKSTFLTRPNFS